MTPLNKVLAGALFAQVALGAITWWPRGGAVSEPTILLDVDPQTVTHLEIVGRTTLDMEDAPEPVILDKVGDDWKITSLSGFPAKAEEVDKVLESLSEIEVRSPIGTTASSHVTLQVADDAFTRHVKLDAADAKHDLYLGAASGTAMHVRTAGQDEVYVLRGVTAWSIADQARRYYDTEYVRPELETVTSFRIKNAQGDYTLTKAGDAWRCDTLEDPSALDNDEAAALASSLLNIRIHDPVSTEVTPAHGLDGTVRVEWTVAANDTTTSHGYTVGVFDDESKYTIKADDSAWVVRVNESSVKRAVETDFAFLKGAPPLEETNSPPGGFFGDGG